MSAVVELRRLPLTPEEHRALWVRLSQDRSLADLPYKVETDAWGGIHVSPVQSRRSRMSRRVARLLESALGGEALHELAIVTDIGTKVADVGWCSEAFLATDWSDIVLTKAPEICVEVVSPGNSESEMREKTRAYLAAGAVEVWIVADSGAVEVHAVQGRRDRSSFPVDVERLIFDE